METQVDFREFRMTELPFFSSEVVNLENSGLPQKWKFGTVFFRWTISFQHYPGAEFEVTWVLRS